MSKYEVTLKAPDSAQQRIVSLEAPDGATARLHAERQELEVVKFSLLPPERDLWECPPGGPDSPDGLVNLARWDAYDQRFARHAARLTYDQAVRDAKIR